jgi:L-methionine (R)-S-oxide reductase
MNELFELLYKKIIVILSNKEDSVEEKMMQICMLLSERVSYYDWVGFYLVDRNKSKMLNLGPYVGDPTDHVCIQFGVGICGQTAETKKIFVVQDVAQVTNYLSCSPKVKSEIVVPIMRGDEFIGELDIDSHETGPFTKEDEEFLSKVCENIEPLI